MRNSGHGFVGTFLGNCSTCVALFRALGQILGALGHCLAGVLPALGQRLAGFSQQNHTSGTIFSCLSHTGKGFLLTFDLLGNASQKQHKRIGLRDVPRGSNLPHAWAPVHLKARRAFLRDCRPVLNEMLRPSNNLPCRTNAMRPTWPNKTRAGCWQLFWKARAQKLHAAGSHVKF